MMERLRVPLWLAGQPQLARPIVVFQSDDWGYTSARDKDTLCAIWPQALASEGPWARDSRESVADVEALASVLAAFRDSDGRAPCFTLNYVVHEPDYDAIEVSRLARYESLPQRRDDAMCAVSEFASRARVFEPALHGAEHVSPERWLARLRAGDPDLLAFFRGRVMPPPALVARHAGLGAAYLPVTESERQAASPEVRVAGAAHAFDRLFGEGALGFVAPNHAWEPALEEVLAAEGVRYLQAAQYCYPSWQAFEDRQWRPNRAGTLGRGGVCYQTRTVDFEPAVHPDRARRAMQRACLLAERRIPVVVNTHRVNYVGAMDSDASQRSRDALRELLSRLLDRTADLCFVTSAELDETLRSRASFRASWAARGRRLIGDVVRVGLRKDAFEDVE